MRPSSVLIRPAVDADLDAFFAYLNDHLADNGVGGTALFMPLARGESRLPVERERAFRTGLGAPLGYSGWRRAFIAITSDGRIAGHIDLRARPERASAHRALLGMGVHRNHRRQGLGQRLIARATEWALAHTALEWIDLEVLSVNEAAQQLYVHCGYQQIGNIADMFRIDGEQLAYTLMTRKIR